MIRISSTAIFLCLLFACSEGNGSISSPPGAPDPVATDQPPKAVIMAPAQAYESETITVSGESSTDAEGAIASYKWSASSKDVTLSSSASENVDVTVGELPSDTSFELTLTVSDSVGQTSATTASISILTVEGVDQDQNGVRDDVENVIEELFGTSGRLYEMGMDIAQAKQSLLNSDQVSDSEVLGYLDAANLAGICLMLDDSQLDVTEALAKIQIAMANNEIRRNAVHKYELRLSELGPLDLPTNADIVNECASKYP